MKESQKLIFPSTNVDIQRQKNLELEIEKKLEFNMGWIRTGEGSRTSENP